MKDETMDGPPPFVIPKGACRKLRQRLPGGLAGEKLQHGVAEYTEHTEKNGEKILL